MPHERPRQSGPKTGTKYIDRKVIAKRMEVRLSGVALARVQQLQQKIRQETGQNVSQSWAVNALIVNPEAHL